MSGGKSGMKLAQAFTLPPLPESYQELVLSRRRPLTYQMCCGRDPNTPYEAQLRQLRHPVLAQQNGAAPWSLDLHMLTEPKIGGSNSPNRAPIRAETISEFEPNECDASLGVQNNGTIPNGLSRTTSNVSTRPPAPADLAGLGKLERRHTYNPHSSESPFKIVPIANLLPGFILVIWDLHSPDLEHRTFYKASYFTDGSLQGPHSRVTPCSPVESREHGLRSTPPIASTPRRSHRYPFRPGPVSAPEIARTAPHAPTVPSRPLGSALLERVPPRLDRNILTTDQSDAGSVGI
eukprot:671753-Prorocentrum_minimum.AAC.2